MTTNHRPKRRSVLDDAFHRCYQAGMAIIVFLLVIGILEKAGS